MVAVVHAAPALAEAQAAKDWLEQITPDYVEADRMALQRAIDFAFERYGDLVTPEGETWARRALGTAAILAGLKLDRQALAAALLLSVPALGAEASERLRETFGPEVASLVDGVARMGQIHARAQAPGGHDRAAQAEPLRKMLLAMVEDIRVVLIKLAERTQALRAATAAGAPHARHDAEEVLEIFAPLANRLGVWQIKWELEDLSLRALEPDVYKSIARALDERRMDREGYIRDVMARLSRELAAAGLKAEVTGRPKHIYSIWRKMQRKGATIDELYDIRAVRILVPEVRDCYTALGIVHNLWQPLPQEFDDYIARPKPNDYRSLHTAVVGPDDKPLEVQIRTFDMHQHSEYGVAAHWRYKEGATRRDPGFEEKIAWLRQILDWKREVSDAGELLEQFKGGLFENTIYVFTPQGKVVDLPAGSTPVDFAYHVHTSLGHRCRGAKVDGTIVPLNYPLRNGQRVDITAAKEGGPSRDWLNADLGFLASARAKAKVRQWFKGLQIEQTIAQGRAAVEHEIRREGLTGLNLEDCAHGAGFAKLDDFFTAVGRGEINTRQLQTALRAAAPKAAPAAAPAAPEEEVLTRRSRATGAGSGILIVGVDRLLTGLARCCRPAPPDPIVGFVTRGKGISVHRAGCSNIARMGTSQPERLIRADWGEPSDEVFPIDIEVFAVDRQGLLRDISEVFTREKINVTAVNTLSRNLQAKMSFTVEVRDMGQLAHALALVQEVKGVLEARRRG